VKFHPDRNPGDLAAEERFKDVSQAYAVLSDPAAKAAYERARRARRAAESRAGAAMRDARPRAGNRAEAHGKTRASTSSGPNLAGAGGSQASGSEKSSARASEAGFDEAFGNFFKSAKGRETLHELEKEMARAGLKFNAADFASWFKSRQKNGEPPASKPPSKAAGKPALLTRLLEALTGRSRRKKKETERYDLNYRLALTREAALTGTTVEISHKRDADETPQRLTVRIPSGARDGARLRLSGQGRLKPDQSRGDLILTIAVP
jgi:DnaJ-class molecular chaperone